jgi:hypothetical protein
MGKARKSIFINVKKLKDIRFCCSTLIFLLYSCAMGNLYYAKNGVLMDHVIFSEKNPSILIGIDEKYHYSYESEQRSPAHAYRFEDKSILIDFDRTGQNRANLPVEALYSLSASENYSLKKDKITQGGVEFVSVDFVFKNSESFYLAKAMIHKTAEGDSLYIRS